MRTGLGNSVVEVVLPIFKLMTMGLYLRLRVQFIAGSDSEVLESWQQAGLGKAHMQGFKLLEKLELHGEWLKDRRVLEHARRMSPEGSERLEGRARAA